MEKKHHTTTTERLFLEPLTLEKHLAVFHELWIDEEMVRYTTRIPKTSIQETEEWMPSILPNKEIPDIDKWAIYLRPISSSASSLPNHEPIEVATKDEKDKGVFIGIVGTNRWSDQGMETGYCLHKKYWGRGFATEAFKGFLEMFWAMDERKSTTHLVAKVHMENTQSVKVLRKCGGREGEVLKKENLKDGVVEVEELCCWYFDRPT